MRSIVHEHCRAVGHGGARTCMRKQLEAWLTTSSRLTIPGNSNGFAGAGAVVHR
jgi:hypothetical protein